MATRARIARDRVVILTHRPETSFWLVDRSVVDRGIDAPRADLESGEWQRRNAHLLGLDEIDLGYRLLVAGSP